MRLLPYVVALVGMMALVAWFGWGIRRPLRADVRSQPAEPAEADAAPPCPTPHWHNPGVDDGRR